MSYDLIFQQALTLHEQGNLNEAEKLYRQILLTSPSNPDVLNLLGLVAQAKNIHNEAVNLFYQAIQQAPNHAPFHFNLALSLEMLGKSHEAVKSYTKALEIDPKIKEAFNNLGLITHNREYFFHAIDLDNDYVEAKANLAITYDKDKAISQLKALCQEYPNHPISFYLLSKYTNNLEDAKKAENLAPESYEIQNQIGGIYLLQNNKAEAKKYFEKSLLLAKDNPIALVNLANITNQEALYKKALDIEPDNLDAHINYANLLYLEKRLPEALEEYRKAVILNPDIAEVSNNLGIILKDLGEYEEALGLFFNAYFKKPELEEISINITETLTLFAQIDKKSHKNALKIAKNWQKEAKSNEFAKYIVAALKGEDVGNNKIYNEKLFDHFADNYELVSQRIDYELPRRLGELMAPLKGTILDLGCGSGLLGGAIFNTGSDKEREERRQRLELIGVDISEKMLKIAKDKGIYKELIQSDIVEYLKKHQEFDYIAAADVFCYFGSLDKIIELCHHKPLYFSVENNHTDENYTLEITGRYKHNETYVRKLLEKHNYHNISSQKLILRTENGKEVEGTLFQAH